MEKVETLFYPYNFIKIRWKFYKFRKKFDGNGNSQQCLEDQSRKNKKIGEFKLSLKIKGISNCFNM